MGDSEKVRVLLILFDGFNTIDMNGPYDILTKSGQSDHFVIKVAAEQEITKSIEGVLVEVGRYLIRSRVPCTEVRITSLTIKKRTVVLDDKLIDRVNTEYDLLVVPGGGSDAVNAQAAKLDSAFMRLIAAFANTVSKSEDKRRVLL